MNRSLRELGAHRFAAASVAVLVGSAGLVAAAPWADGDTASRTSVQWRQTVPDGFRLGLRATDPDSHQEGPRRHLEARVKACGTRLWPRGVPTDTSAVRVVGIEFAQTRQVAVYADSHTAAKAFDALVEAKRGCTTDHHGHRSGTRWRFKQHDLGADALFASAQARQSGHQAIGLGLFRWVRVGNAIGYTSEGGEGRLRSPRSTDHADRQARDLRRRMCVFKVRPCSSSRASGGDESRPTV